MTKWFCKLSRGIKVGSRGDDDKVRWIALLIWINPNYHVLQRLKLMEMKIVISYLKRGNIWISPKIKHNNKNLNTIPPYGTTLKHEWSQLNYINKMLSQTPPHEYS